MSFPSYLLQHGNQFAVAARSLYGHMGFNDRYFPDWFKDRIEKLSLIEATDYLSYKLSHGVLCYLVTVPVAVRLLITERRAAGKAARQQLNDLVPQLEQEGLHSADIDLADFVKAIASTNSALTTLSTPQPHISSLQSQKLTESNLTALPAPIPLLQIDGRAAVNVQDLFRFWHPETDTRLAQWFGYRITKLGFVLGKHYVEYNEQPVPGHRRGTTGYIVSIDAAIAIAEGENKGKGTLVSQYLITYRKELAKQRLSTKGSLTDFIGIRPAESAPAVMPSEGAEPLSLQPSLFDVLPEPLTDEARKPRSVTNDALASNKESEDHDQNGVHADPSISGSEVKSSEPESKPVSAAALLLQTAQLLLQQAQLLVDHEQRLNQTQTTVGQIVAIGQQAALQTMGLSAGHEQPPQQTLRSRIRQIVNARCRKTGEFQDQVYAFIYNRLYYLYGVSVASHHRQKEESYLELCERLGILDKVYTIVTSAEFNVAMNEAPVHPRQEAA
ncbi:antA/AntB antirepressor family protein [Larkinella terrae]|uniref:AntA/AntB antirepressor domain-containing protein n=1 Tax=Larkinella terrae TaxID=2025311 RepID=A0A7K0EEI1_9BACT|nr:antA/AntB antirepressor family protein [Larkinella terrae]MRS59866.1 hypothetical protein [Larkinella terrae]